MSREIKVQEKVKSFADLKFQQHPFSWSGKITHCRFRNGYGLSVVNVNFAYCDNDTYEVAILKDEEVIYNTPLTDYVLAYQTEEDIDHLISMVSSWKKDQY